MFCMCCMELDSCGPYALSPDISDIEAAPFYTSQHTLFSGKQRDLESAPGWLLPAKERKGLRVCRSAWGSIWLLACTIGPYTLGISIFEVMPNMSLNDKSEVQLQNSLLTATKH